MKPLVFCAFSPCGCLSFCFEDDEAAFGFQTGERRQKGAEILSLCFKHPPPFIKWTLPNPSVAPHGLTHSLEQRWCLICSDFEQFIISEQEKS